MLPLFERLWSSQLLLELRGVAKLHRSSRKDSWRYFQCVLEDLLVTQASSFEATFHVLDEFASEVALDLTLKNLCFERTEILMLCLRLIAELRRLEPADFAWVSDRGVRAVFPPDLARKVRAQTVQSEETQRQCMQLATKRLERIISVLETVCAVFYASDTCQPALRRSLLLRDSPVGLSTWVPLLAVDLALDQLLLLGCIRPAASAAPSPSAGPSSSSPSRAAASSVDLDGDLAALAEPLLDDEAFDRGKPPRRSPLLCPDACPDLV